ncbi:hypothetical protein GCM10029976_083780 [Kribbella albertanoniae]|uniref:Abortive infection protein n=1 Tax=Kribbella albertanoniae TaxID=1266829 RepID=A0A4V2XPU0_9ACTN|nr:hypothetical protein [Kribbella albertanoniae]TDC23315.1 hypothetical protein E1261_28775 [Kribbella albertanoniae]
MRAVGVTYDTGVLYDGRSTRRRFASGTVRAELRLIAAELHAPAVRVVGNDLDRLVLAGEAALDAGLELWFSPMPMDLEPEQFIEFLAECAAAAEILRKRGEVVLVLGCELSVFCRGFVPGETERRLVAAARVVFGGRITYAAGMWEDVDWALYDIVAVDAYRDAQNEATFADNLRELQKWGKPVVATEFGCCAYRGAAARGGKGWMIVDRTLDPPRLDGRYERDEEEQVRYLRELVEVFDRTGLDAAFWFSFAGFELPHRPGDPVHDLDVSSYGLVAVDELGGRQPKRVYGALAELNASRSG